jgi:uncharacterized membrane protein
VSSIILKLNKAIINPLITLLFAIALVIFIYGIIEFIRNRDTDSDKANEGKRHMMWGIIGLAIMVSAFGIMRIIAATIGSDIVTP